MTNEAIVDIMRNLKSEWTILKDEKKAKIDRRKACKSIIELSEMAKELDPKFEIIGMNNTNYAEFVPKTYKSNSNVNWERPVIKIAEKYDVAVNLAFDMEEIAIQWTKFRLPNEPEDSQKFGMITNANTEKLLRAYKITNL